MSELNPSDVLALILEITGSMKIDYDGETYHDIYTNNTYKAMEVRLTRSDVDITASPQVNPEIVITLPKISFTNWTPDRPIDDIASQDIEFMAHHDTDEAKAIEVVLTNEIANYD